MTMVNKELGEGVAPTGDALRSGLLSAALACPHEIDQGKVVLEFSKTQPGANALAQLVDRLIAVSPQGMKAASDAELLAEINRRGMLQPLYGAIGAMHDHLDRTGALDEKLTQYLAYRLRREEAAITGASDSAARVANWQECIDRLDQDGALVIHSESEASGPRELLFWSNESGWGELSTATRFSADESNSFNLPRTSGNDATWVLLSEAMEMVHGLDIERPRA